MLRYRPIALLNSVFKIISKVLANRLSSMISVLVGEAQIGFIANINIVDDIAIAQEVLHQCKGRVDGFLLKLDFEKAYNTVC